MTSPHVAPLIFASHLLPPPFPPTSRPSLLSDRRLSSNRALGSSSSSAHSQARIASRRPSPIRLVASITQFQLGSGSVQNSIANLEMAMLYISRFRTFSMSPFTSPFYTFISPLDVTFDYRQTFLPPRRFHPRRREPHDHLIIFLCPRTLSTMSCSPVAGSTIPEFVSFYFL